MITTAWPHCVDSDLKYICVYKRIMYLCASLSKYTCEYLCNYLVCVSPGHIFVCVYVQLKGMGSQLSSSTVMGSSGSLCERAILRLNVFMRDLSDTHVTSLALQLAHLCMHQQSCLFQKSPANQHSFRCNGDQTKAVNSSRVNNQNHMRQGDMRERCWVLQTACITDTHTHTSYPLMEQCTH